MIVYKNYFNIAKRNLGLIVLFITIAVVVSIANANFASSDEKYVNAEPKIGIINYDSSKLVDNYIEYLNKHSKKLAFVNNNKKEIQDALYNNTFDVIMIIPNDFTDNLMHGNKPTIETKKSTKTFSEFSDLMTNQYFKVASIYAHLNLSEEQMISRINANLSQDVKVEMLKKSDSNTTKNMAALYIIENYSYLSILLLIIGNIMCVFNDTNIKRRNSICKLSKSSFSRQLFLGHVTLGLAVWLIFAVISYILYKDIFSWNSLLYMLNSLVLVFTVTAMAYLLGTLVKKKNILSALQNIISLTLCFTSGCFLPAEFLSDGVLNASKIFPSYWYIDNVNRISKMTEFNFDDIKPLLFNAAIVFAFGVLYYGISKMLIAKRRA